jgi:hypothetical protein
MLLQHWFLSLKIRFHVEPGFWVWRFFKWLKRPLRYCSSATPLFLSPFFHFGSSRYLYLSISYVDEYHIVKLLNLSQTALSWSCVTTFEVIPTWSLDFLFGTWFWCRSIRVWEIMASFPVLWNENLHPFEVPIYKIEALRSSIMIWIYIFSRVNDTYGSMIQIAHMTSIHVQWVPYFYKHSLHIYQAYVSCREQGTLLPPVPNLFSFARAKWAKFWAAHSILWCMSKYVEGYIVL